MSDPATPDTLLGRKIGNYVVTGLLGRGGMGEVYLAEHPKIGRKVAIKVLASHLLTTEFLASRFLAEAKAVARIDHPNVIDIYDYGNLDDGRLYYVMELLTGRELRAVIDERGTLSPAEVVPFLEQICGGLQAAHERGVIHRDLKPENVFVLDRQPLALKLLDFGIAKLLETEQGSGLTSSGMVMGTPLYIAPEQALGQPERISPRTDLYSLGVMLYWMMSGRTPFQSDANAVLLAMHIRDAPPPLRSVAPSVPPGIAEIVERCLAKEPGQRPGSAAELAHAFGQAVAASTTGPPTLTAPAVEAARSAVATAAGRRTTFTAASGESVAVPSEEFKTLTRRPVARKVAIGAVVVAVAGGIVLVLLHGPRRSPPKQEQQPPPVAAQRTPDSGGAGAAPASAPTPRQQVAVRAHDARAGDAKIARRPKVATGARPVATKKLPVAAKKLPVAQPAGATPPAKPKPARKNVGEGTMEMDD